MTTPSQIMLTLAVTLFMGTACSHYQLAGEGTPVSVFTIATDPTLDLDAATSTKRLVANLNDRGWSATWATKGTPLRCDVHTDNDGVSTERIFASANVSCTHQRTTHSIRVDSSVVTQSRATANQRDDVFRSAIDDAIIRAAIIVLEQSNG